MIGAGHTGGGSNIGKVPIAEIAIERVGRVEAAKVKIAETVAIDVACRDAGSIEKNLVGERSFLVEAIGEGNAGAHGVDNREARLSARGNGQRRATMTFLLLPIEPCGAQTGQRGPGHDAVQQVTTLRHGSQKVSGEDVGCQEKPKRAALLAIGGGRNGCRPGSQGSL